MKIGICGGTFDPFHRGHFDPVVSVRAAMQWDRVIWIPAHAQPFKEEMGTASPFHRFAMAVLATEERDDFFVSTIELERGKISYTVDTLEHLRRAFPDATLDWIIGEDNLEALHRWRSIDTIFDLANFVVLTRTNVLPKGDGAGGEGRRMIEPRVVVPAERATHGGVVFAENATVPISSTEIRRRVREGESIADLVDPRVSRYIQHYGLYRKGQS